jgi:putative transposase
VLVIFHKQEMKGGFMPHGDLSGVLDLYGQAVPKQFFEQLQRELGLPERQRVFTLPLLVWLMVSQRLDPKATLSTAVQQVVQQQPRTLLSDHKRIRETTVSCHTGAYSDARRAMPVVVAEKVADRVLDHLLQSRREALLGWTRRVFILDGSSLEMPHTTDLAEAYPPHSKSHWPVLLMLVAQELTTGLAERPCWGPMYGPKAVSEQALTEQLLDRLPGNSVVMGDINFGVFSVTFAAAQRGHDVLVRLQPNRAAALGQGLQLQSGLDQELCWRPSAYERKRHPALPADACVQGRLIMQQVTASDGSSVTLYLFTTLALTLEQLLQLYGQRWDVETDLRSLKRTVDLQVLRCKSVDMIAKELILAMVGYNLVRAVMNAAAEEHQLNPRRLSFSRSQDVVLAALPGLAAATTPVQYQARLRRMLQLVASCKLPQRSARRSTPREVWGHGCKFTKRKVNPSTAT